MKKQDLKTSMLVQLRDKNRYIVVFNSSLGDILIMNTRLILLHEYNNNLTHINCKSLDIIAVFNPNHKNMYSKRKDWYKQCILWESNKI